MLPIFPRNILAFPFSDIDFETREDAARFSQENVHAIRLFDFEFEAGEDAAHFSQDIFPVRFPDFESRESAAHFSQDIFHDIRFLILKQWEMLPIFSKEFFRAIRFSHFEFETRGNAANVSPKNIHAIWFSDFEFETGENVAVAQAKEA